MFETTNQNWFICRISTTKQASIVGRDVAFLLSEGQILVRRGGLQRLPGCDSFRIFFFEQNCDI
jgi:hypothetical protein